MKKWLNYIGIATTGLALLLGSPRKASELQRIDEVTPVKLEERVLARVCDPDLISERDYPNCIRDGSLSKRNRVSKKMVQRAIFEIKEFYPTFTREDAILLANVLYYEVGWRTQFPNPINSRSLLNEEIYKESVAITSVVDNRAKRRKKSIREILLEKYNGGKNYQFNCIDRFDKLRGVKKDSYRFYVVFCAMEDKLTDKVKDPTFGATYYQNPSLTKGRNSFNAWLDDGLILTCRVNDHVFFRERETKAYPLTASFQPFRGIELFD